MTTGGVQAARWRAAVLGAALVAGIGGYWLGQSGGDEAAPSGGESRKVLYYFDPMFPNQKFEKPGKFLSWRWSWSPNTQMREWVLLADRRA